MQQVKTGEVINNKRMLNILLCISLVTSPKSLSVGGGDGPNNAFFGDNVDSDRNNNPFNRGEGGGGLALVRKWEGGDCIQEKLGES